MIFPLPSLISGHDLGVLMDLAASAPPGCFVEIGVYQGGSASCLYEIAEAQGRTLHLYDTFAGHPVVTDKDDLSTHPLGRYGGDAVHPTVLAAYLPNARIHVGVFPDTLTDDVQDIAFVHSDADLYAPTLAACTLLPPRMVPGGMLLFDDYSWRVQCPGVVAAVIEVFGEGPTLPNGKRLVTLPGVEQAR